MFTTRIYFICQQRILIAIFDYLFIQFFPFAPHRFSHRNAHCCAMVDSLLLASLGSQTLPVEVLGGLTCAPKVEGESLQQIVLGPAG